MDLALRDAALKAGRSLTVGALAVAAVVGTVALAAFAFERVEKTVAGPPGAEAQANPFLAAERFLDRMGLPADSRSRLTPLPERDRLLLIGPESRAIGVRQADALLDWVADGGHLVVGPYLENGRVTDATHSDPLLLALGVGVFEASSTEEGSARVEYPLDLDDSGDPATVRFYQGHGVAFQSEDGNERSYNLVYDDYGEGRFYVVNDTGFLSNVEIGDLDHARLLWDIVRFGAPRAGALLIYGGTYESLLTLLLHYAWPFLLAGAASLGALAWRNAARFGPLLAPRVAAHRGVMDHVEAAGHFFWRRRRPDVLLGGIRRELLRRVGLRRPHLTRLEEAQQSAILAEGTALEPVDIEAALFGVCPHRREAYTRCMRTLTALRRSL